MPTIHVLNDGYVGERVASTVSLIEAGDALVVVDPGMVSTRGVILDPIAALGFAAEDVTDVVISHHHPDHTINIALFPSPVRKGVNRSPSRPSHPSPTVMFKVHSMSSVHPRSGMGLMSTAVMIPTGLSRGLADGLRKAR